MSSLPKNAFILKGGCFCSAIRYVVSVPALEDRPKLPILPSSDVRIIPQNETNERLPMIDVDHCTSCRRISGSVIQLWFIIPQTWVQFSLLSRASEAPPPRIGPFDLSTTTTEPVIKPSTIQVLTGVPELLSTTYLAKFSSSEGVNRNFCGRCGTNLTFHYERLGGMAKEAANQGLDWAAHMDISMGSLDTESLETEGLRPAERVHVADSIGWVEKWLREGESALLE